LFSALAASNTGINFSDFMNWTPLGGGGGGGVSTSVIAFLPLLQAVIKTSKLKAKNSFFTIIDFRFLTDPKINQMTRNYLIDGLKE